MVFFRLFKTSLANIVKEQSVFAHFPQLKHTPLLVQSDDTHLQAVMEWLCVAQDATGTGGVSALYDLLERKWAPPYRETTGYIINTFLQYYALTGNQEYERRAMAMAEWELHEQRSDGSFGEPGKAGKINKKVFNTGQIVFGLLSAYTHTGDVRFLDSARRAGNWLVSNQESDGSWVEPGSSGTGKTYQSRVAWALLELHAMTRDARYEIAAQKNIQWVLNQRQKNFWFDNTSLSVTNEPWTHLISYTISGLQESNRFLNDPVVQESYVGAAQKLLEYYDTHDGFLPGSFDAAWHSRDAYSCLTGDAQLALIWMGMYNETGRKEFFDGAVKALHQVKTTQILQGAKEIRGGIAGSYPIGGAYASYCLINWAAKFFADALMMKMKIGNT